MVTRVQERSAVSERGSQGVSHLLRLPRTGRNSAACVDVLAVGDEHVDAGELVSAAMEALRAVPGRSQ